ncbi:copper oxidase [Gracilaria domingensis]|nr:copper oxidase [Gracilaria domingensis]
MFPIGFQLDALWRVGSHAPLRRPPQVVRLVFRATQAKAAARAARHSARACRLAHATVPRHAGGRAPSVAARRAGARASRAVGRAAGGRRGRRRAGGKPRALEQRPRVLRAGALRVCARVGNEEGVQTAHLHGLVGVSAGGKHVDSARLLPGSTAVVQLVPGIVGAWLFHCHVDDHLHAGMEAVLAVRPAADEKEKTAPFVPTSCRVCSCYFGSKVRAVQRPVRCAYQG